MGESNETFSKPPLSDNGANDNSFLSQLATFNLYDSEDLVIQNSDRLIADVRAYLKSSGYDMALACLDLAVEKKQGLFRYDGKTPSILHEVTQALYTISLIESGVHLDDPESIIALNFIHDLGEEFGLKPSDLRKYLREHNIETNDRTILLSTDLNLLTKQYKDRPPKFKHEHEYYVTLQSSQNASLAKIIDRIHNVATQIGVKSDEKCLEYISETMLITDDFVATSSKAFPNQEEAYKICRQVVKTACQVSRYYHSRKKMGKPLPDIEELQEEHMPSRGFNVPMGLNPILIPAERAMAAAGWNKEQILPYNISFSQRLRERIAQFTFSS